MKLYKLSLANVTKSFKDYAIYFFTLILGVSIFYVFNSLDSQTAMLTFSSGMSEVINLLMQLISGTSVFISFVLGFLIIYASGFLIKKRNKEFGVYMLLGMDKKKISLMLLMETIIIGLISLAVGLAIGVGISQLTSIFVAKMFDADMSAFQFNFSYMATIKTIIYFAIIYLIVMVFNTVIINRCKLIDLLQAAKKSEKVRMKNPILCIAVFVVSVALLGTAYWMVTEGISLATDASNRVYLAIVMGCLGTYLFFFSVSGLALKIVSGMEKIYYRGLNSFTFKQLSSKINTMVSSISIICIMLFLTICLLAAGLSIKNQFNGSLQKLAPVDFQIYESLYSNHYSEDELMEMLKGDEVYSSLRDVTLVKQYYDNDFLYEQSLGLYAEELKEVYPLVNYNALVEIMSESDYNLMAELYHLEKIDLESNQYAIVANYKTNLYDETMARGSKLSIFGKELSPVSSKTMDGYSHISGNPSNIGLFVVSDEIVAEEEYSVLLVMGNFASKDKTAIAECDKKIVDFAKSNYLNANTKTGVKDSTVGLSAIATFIGLYLGIIFLISSAAILALKQLSDMIDDKSKYRILRNIGVDERDINKSIFKQTLIFFLMPLLLACVHTVYGIKFSVIVLSILGISNMTKAIAITALFIIAIYGGYFLLTYYSSLSIVRTDSSNNRIVLNNKVFRKE